jgi:hypothetical protein
VIPAQRTVTVAFLNVSTVVTAAELTAAVAALQVQVSRDFGPIYGINANLTVVTDPNVIPSAWLIVVGDDSDQIGALGYHELTAAGQPLGKVFAKTDQGYQLSWTVTASHELLEMLADPWCCLCAYGTDGKVRAYEVCDPVEADELGYQVDGGFGPQQLSDFVLPAWFNGSPGPYDRQGRCPQPLTLLPGGYISLLGPDGWGQVQAEKVEPTGRVPIKPGSRRNKRTISRAAWRSSVVSGS